LPLKNTVEVCRAEIQQSLDEKKTPLERNELGQFATPKNLADAIMLAALSYIPKDQKIRFLEPSIGTGSFFSALLDKSTDDQIEYACGYEIDEHYARPSIDLWKTTILKYVVGDFLIFAPPQNESDKFNLIVSNPPYVRHHHLRNGLKEKLHDKVKTTFGISFSKLSGLYCYFLSLTAKWLRIDGISVWLIPGEFLDVNYGVKVKEFLLNNVKLIRIHRFNPDAVQFTDALVTSVVVFYTTGKTLDTVRFSSGEDINNPSAENVITRTKLNSTEKWSSWFFSSESKVEAKQTIGDYFCVKRGIATGSNKHFILSKKQITELDVPDSCWKRILPSPRYVERNVITQNIDGSISDLKELYLLSITCNEDEVNKLPIKLQNYLVKVKEEIGNNYLVSKRKPWYRQENRTICPFLLTYMGRNVNEPFRLFLNLTNATASNGYLMLYPKFDWEIIEKENPGFLKLLHHELLNISSSSFTDSGRVYGGGLFKMEPKELMNTPIDGILSYETLSLISSRLKKTLQLSLFEKPTHYSKKNEKKIV
jgi:hypothetical protein